MSTAKLYIHGMGVFHPENIIDNQFLEDLDIGTNDKWIVDRVGINARRTVLPLDYIKTTKNRDPREAIEAAIYSNAETGKRAAEQAMAQAGITADQVGMVIVGSCSADYSTPAEASTIAEALGINAPAIDLQSACSSFGSHMHFLSMMRADTLPDYILSVLPENNTRMIDFSDRSSAVLWGDGTQATVVSPTLPSRAVIRDTSLGSDPSGWRKVVIPRCGHFAQEGSAVQAFAIKRTVKCFRELAELHPEFADNKPYMIGHQANLAMLRSVAKRCETPDNRHLFNVDNYGNTGAAGAPTVLTQNWDRFKTGDQVAIAVVGAGLTWSRLILEFTESP